MTLEETLILLGPAHMSAGALCVVAAPSPLQSTPPLKWQLQTSPKPSSRSVIPVMALIGTLRELVRSLLG